MNNLDKLTSTPGTYFLQVGEDLEYKFVDLASVTSGEFEVATYPPKPQEKAEAAVEESEVKREKFSFRVSSLEILDEARINRSAFAKAGIQKQPDLLYVRFKLMHEGGNKNLDYFEKEDLKAAASSAVLKPVNWEHGQPTIGLIYYSEYVDPTEEGAKAAADTRAYIIAEAAIWKFTYPDQAKKMVKRYASKTLAFSMEAYFAKAECTKCGAVFAAADHPEGTYCEHLNSRFDTKALAAEDRVYRKLREFFLGGTGVVEDPADIDAEALAVARNQEVRKLDKIELTQAELDAKVKNAVDKALAEAAKDANVGELTQRAETAEATVQEQKTALAEATATIATLTKERDEAKASLQALEDKAARDAKASARQAALDEAGYVAPEDEEVAKANFEKIVDMSDDVFELFTTTVKAGVKKPEGNEEKPAGTSQASVRVPATGGKPKAEAKATDTETAADILARL